MSEQQIIQKLIASNAYVNSRNIRNGSLTEKEYEKISVACRKD